MINPNYDKGLHACKACCEFGLCNYKEACAECEKAPDSDLKAIFCVTSDIEPTDVAYSAKNWRRKDADGIS